MQPDSSPSENGKVTYKQFYDGILSLRDRMDLLEQRLTAKIDKQILDGSPALNARMAAMEKEHTTMCNEINDMKKVTYGWAGINSLLAVIAGILGISWSK
jgi:hypothetical protein